MTSRIPPQIQPYLNFSTQNGLILLTSVLGASSNWLLLRVLSATNPSESTGSRKYGKVEDLEADQVVTNIDEMAVVLVSWMKDFEFWKTEAKKCCGLDLTRLQADRRFTFVDGFSQLFASSGSQQDQSHDTTNAKLSEATIISPSLEKIKITIIDAIKSLKEDPKANAAPRIVILFDMPSILLCTTNPPITAIGLTRLILHLRHFVHTTVISLPADEPLLRPSASAINPSGTSPSPLEAENAAFAMSMAYQARWILGCRCLGTGWAQDVTGILRIARGGAAEADAVKKDGLQDSEVDDGGEWLYYLAANGVANVWERGATR